MLPWSAAELAALAATGASALPETAAIWRPTATRTPDGGTRRTPTLLATVPAACWPAPAGAAPERDQAGRLTLVQRWLVQLPAGTDVTEADHLVVAGHTYEVGTVDRWGTPEAGRTAHCVEVR